MNKRHYIIPIFVSHQGCPHNCVFCNQNSITGQHKEIYAEDVRETAESYLKTMDSKNSIIEISFFGGTFTAIDVKKQEELLAVAYEYKNAGKIDFIRLSTRPDYINDQILSILKRYSVDIIELGVQSMDNEVLKLSGRGHTKSDTINASILIKKYGFILGHQIMIGLPGDSFRKDIQTVYDIVQLEPDLCRIYPALVLKDTPMESMYNSRRYKPYSLEEAIDITKKLYMILLHNNIDIIRVGLQATDNISEGKDIVNGPYHPAFRELVEGSILCDIILEELFDKKGEIKITVNPKDISKLYTNKKQFFIDIKKQLNTKMFTVKTDNSVKRGEILFQSEEMCKSMSVKDYSYKKIKEGKIYNL